jgi:hypothetical protein
VAKTSCHSIKFPDTSNLGKNYRNDLFVGYFNYGNLFHFDLNRNRTQVLFNPSLTYNISFAGEDILIVDSHCLQDCNNAFSWYVVSDDLSNNLGSKILMISTPVGLER